MIELLLLLARELEALEVDPVSGDQILLLLQDEFGNGFDLVHRVIGLNDAHSVEVLHCSLNIGDVLVGGEEAVLVVELAVVQYLLRLEYPSVRDIGELVDGLVVMVVPNQVLYHDGGENVEVLQGRDLHLL